MKKEVKQEKTENKIRPNQYELSNLKLVEWINKDDKGNEFKSFQIRKFYKDEEGNWKDTDNLGDRELLILRELLNQVIVERFPVKFRENN